MDPSISVQNKNFSGNSKKACKSSWSPIGSQESFTLTIPWNSAKLVKISPGIIAHLHHKDRRTNGIADRAVRRVKEETSAVLSQSGLDNEWLADSMRCYCYLRNIQDLLSDGKTPYERRFGKPFNGPVIPFGGNARKSPYPCDGHIETTSVRQESFCEVYSSVMYCMR